ncbi:hypothetical protein FP2506_09836 [Fulvimarina pelagi HTCC2506]|uniref:Uncharacterized protein n=1 Tax=Fulvimarina pelagi HTCC2506 TaxID=314231 RepID=Q0G5C9_9HYPH|nr:hypothetical protein [Fulvimarina pelagi]EAU43135.1 hypothetical protein FP2506_09836 [Fulvimarina pelagi HTCC2506]
MAKHPAPIVDLVDDLPPTPAELTEGRRIAYRHFSHILALLKEAGRLSRPPKRRRHGDRIRAGDDARRALPLDPDSLDQHLSEMAQTLFHHCRRPECRRAFQCRFGARASEPGNSGDTWGRTGLPCLQQLPADVANALHLMLVRQNAPQVFRERNNFQALERQVLARAAKRFGPGKTFGETPADDVSRTPSSDGAR